MYTCLSESSRVLKENGMLWATFRHFETDDIFSPPRVVGNEVKQFGHSASELLHLIRTLNMQVTALDSVTGYVTQNGFSVPYYVLQARKVNTTRPS